MNRVKRALETIEKIVTINNGDEKNPLLSEIYIIVHPFVGNCDNPHWDWREKQEKLLKNLESY